MTSAHTSVSGPRVGQSSGPTPIEYVVLFLVVVAGILTLVR